MEDYLPVRYRTTMSAEEQAYHAAAAAAASHHSSSPGTIAGVKRSADEAGMHHQSHHQQHHQQYICDTNGMSSKQHSPGMMSGVPSTSPSGSGSGTGGQVQDPQPSTSEAGQKTALPNGKKTKGRVKIKMEFIDNKLRRYTTFSKRKTGIMKKVGALQPAACNKWWLP